MTEDERWELGVKTFKEVYGYVVPPPSRDNEFGKICVQQQFAELWARDVLPRRERRVGILGVLLALGEDVPFRIHAESALANGELTPEELHELLLFLTPYVGYPRATKMLPIVGELAKQYSET